MGGGGFRLDFPSHKSGAVKKIGGVVLKKNKKRELSLIFILNNPFQCYLSLSVWLVCVCVCVLFIYTTFISIICVSKTNSFKGQHLKKGG